MVRRVAGRGRRRPSKAIGGRQREALELLAEKQSLLVEDFHALPVRWATNAELFEMVDSLVRMGYITCADETTTESSAVTITHEGACIARENFAKANKGLYDEASLRMLRDVGKAVREGRKVCVITSSQRRGSVKQSLTAMFRGAKNILVTSVGDSHFDWLRFRIPDAPEFEVYVEPFLIEKYLKGALEFRAKYR